MNATQVKQVEAIRETTEANKTRLNGIMNNLQEYYDIMNYLQEYYDNRSETWQESDEAAAVQDQLDALENAIAGLEEVIEHLDNATAN